MTLKGFREKNTKNKEGHIFSFLSTVIASSEKERKVDRKLFEKSFEVKIWNVGKC